MSQSTEISEKSAESPTGKMPISTPRLLRLAGLSALVAGLCYVLVGVFHPANAPVVGITGYSPDSITESPQLLSWAASL